MKRFMFIPLFLCWQASLFASITVDVEPKHIPLGEAFQLILTTDNLSSKGLPDLTPLDENFTVMGTERKLSYSAINGVAHATSQWIILLVPKKSGTLTIPSMQIGQDLSPPTQIRVDTGAKKPTVPIENNDLVFLRANTNQKEAYVNEQVIYTVKLYSRVPLLDAHFEPPRVDNALFFPLGDGRRYEQVLNGYRYTVDEQDYAIFPQKKGNLTVIPPTLTAVLYDALPNQIHLSAPHARVVIKPTPPRAKDEAWLAAKNVTLTETYTPPTDTFQVGDTIIRKVTLEASAVPAELLPTLNFTNNKQIAMYPGARKTQNSFKNHTLIGTSTIKMTYVLNHAGSITLPALKLPWFNTQTRQFATTILPERTITVHAKPVTTTKPVIKQNKPSIAPATNLMGWWIAAGFALIWLITLLLWWFSQKHPLVIHKNKALHDACINNNPIDAQDALLAWAKQKWPQQNILDLHDIRHLIHDDEFKKQLFLLSQVLYSPRQTGWRGMPLWQCVKRYRPAHTQKPQKKQDLPRLNPKRSKSD